MATIAVLDGERDVHVIFELRIRPDFHLPPAHGGGGRGGDFR